MHRISGQREGTKIIRRSGLLGLITGVAFAVTSLAQVPPPDASWTANAVVEASRSITDLELGAVQGVVVRDGRIYAYGDLVSASPRVGVIREYDQDLKATGRAIRLTKDGKPLILHPTGLTWNQRWGTFLGDTIKKRAVIYQLDWERAWADGHLDHAVLDIIDDDAAINGCRPTFVILSGRTFLATADYGDIRPEIRLCDPDALLKAGRTSAPGVVLHRVLCGPFNQNLYWDDKSGQLTCIQNVAEGRGWRLEVLDLARAVADGRAHGPGVRTRSLVFMPHDELEGYWPLDRNRSLFAVARRSNNVLIDTIRRTEPRLSPPGAR